MTTPGVSRVSRVSSEFQEVSRVSCEFQAFQEIALETLEIISQLQELLLKLSNSCY